MATPDRSGFRTWFEDCLGKLRGRRIEWPQLLRHALAEKFNEVARSGIFYKGDVFIDRDAATEKFRTDSRTTEKILVRQLYRLAHELNQGLLRVGDEDVWLVSWEVPNQGSEASVAAKGRRVDLLGVKRDGGLVVFEGTHGFKSPRLSPRYICVPSLGVFGIGGDQSERVQVAAFVDALHWHRHLPKGTRPLTFVIGSGPHTPSVLDAIATLHDALNTRIAVTVEVDRIPQKLSLPDFNSLGEKCLMRFGTAGPVIPPESVVKLATRLESCPVFRWYRTSTGKWSGRVDGLEVCTLGGDEESFTLKVGELGKQGAESEGRQRFRELTGQDTHRFGLSDLEAAAQLIEVVAKDRESGPLAEVELEHRIESLILREQLRIEVDGKRLEPKFQAFPFQFPVYWSKNGNPKFVDVLMHSGRELWVVELKAPNRGQGQYFRHTVGQVALYRAFIRRAKPLHDWFDGHFQLDAEGCKAVALLPTPRGPQADSLRRDVEAVADLLDVKVVYFDWPVPAAV